MKDLVVIKTFDSEIEANIVKGRLEAEGIISLVQGGNVIPYLSFFTPGRKGVQLKVFHQDADKARQLIESDEN